MACPHYGAALQKGLTCPAVALYALAYHEPLADIADRHGLSPAAVRQRVTRARKRLQPDLTAYRRAG